MAIAYRFSVVVLQICMCCLAMGCEDAPPNTVIQWQSYDGAAYDRPRPPIAWPQGPIGLTSNSGSDTLTALDLTQWQVLGSIPVGRLPIDTDGPHHLTMDRAAGTVHVALAYPQPAVAPGPHAAHGSSKRPGWLQRLALDDLRVLDEVPIDSNPGDIVRSDDGQRLLITHFDLGLAARDDLSVAERRANVTLASAKGPLAASVQALPVCILPHAAVLSPGTGQRAWVACYGEDTVAVVDLQPKPSVVARIAVGPAPGPPGSPLYGPYAATRSPDGQRLALGQTESKDLRFFDTSAGAMVEPVVPCGGQPYFAGWRADGQALYVPVQQPDSLLMVDASTGTVTTQRNFGSECVRPHEVQVLDAQKILVVCEGRHGGTQPDVAGNVLVVNALTLQTIASMSVGIYPDRLAWAPAVAP